VEAKKGLVVLSDTGDAVYGGAPGDSTSLLGEMVRQRIPCQAFLPMVDPLAVDQAFEQGLGRASLTVGGRCDPFSEPIRLDGRITALSRGLTLASSRGITDIGRTVLFEVEKVKIVLMAKGSYAVNQPILYTHLGLRIEDSKMVVLKTGSNFQYFAPWQSKLIRADTPGTTQSDLTALEWKKLPRPIYPLDSIPRWEAVAVNAG
jgi:microcystin degradation protein MlrC